jgi:RNA polymerase primary sigma factor
MRKSNATAAKGEPFVQSSPPAQDLAALSLIEDDQAEETAIRPRPADLADDEPQAEFLDLDLGPVDRLPQIERSTRLQDREMKDVEEGGGDSMLARYFRDMALHPVMGPDEELDAARAVERTETDHWVAILSFLPAAEYILAGLEEDIAKAGEDEVKAPQIEELQKLVRSAKKQKGGRLTAEQEKQWAQLSEELAVAIRLPDSDIWSASRTWRTT